jgi:hypothetical protein
MMENLTKAQKRLYCGEIQVINKQVKNPVPTVRDTLEKYLKYLTPPPACFHEAKHVCLKF